MAGSELVFQMRRASLPFGWRDILVGSTTTDELCLAWKGFSTTRQRRTILLALAAIWPPFFTTRVLERRRDKLALVTRRLDEFYGPLLMWPRRRAIFAYRSLLKKAGQTQSFPILDGEMKEWMLWMTTIFMPLNDIREKDHHRKGI